MGRAEWSGAHIIALGSQAQERAYA